VVLRERPLAAPEVSTRCQRSAPGSWICAFLAGNRAFLGCGL